MTKEFIYENKPTAKIREEFLKWIEKNTDFEYVSIGKSMLGEKITVYKIGKGKRHVLYVGAHHASEYLSARSPLFVTLRYATSV